MAAIKQDSGGEVWWERRGRRKVGEKNSYLMAAGGSRKYPGAKIEMELTSSEEYIKHRSWQPHSRAHENYMYQQVFCPREESFCLISHPSD